MKAFRTGKRAFTLVELMVSISIFFIMTALLVAKYGNFNNSVLLTNLAYDIALTIRTAQTYGISVQGQQNIFQYPYGVAFCVLDSCAGGETSFGNKQIVLFADKNNSKGAYDTVGGNADIEKNTYSIQRGAKIVKICSLVNGVCATNYNRAEISFQRPNPDAIICGSTSGAPNACAAGTTLDALEIVIQAPDGSTRKVDVNKVGQVSVP